MKKLRGRNGCHKRGFPARRKVLLADIAIYWSLVISRRHWTLFRLQKDKNSRLISTKMRNIVTMLGLIIFMVNLPQITSFTPFPPSSLSCCCLLTCRSLSWLCLSRMRTRSCSSSTVPWSRSFSSIMALRRCSSSRFLSVSILICRGKRGGVRPCTFQGAERREIAFPREETAKSKSMHGGILYLYERNCMYVCGLKLRKALKRISSFPWLHGQLQRGWVRIATKPGRRQKCPHGLSGDQPCPPLVP